MHQSHGKGGKVSYVFTHCFSHSKKIHSSRHGKYNDDDRSLSPLSNNSSSNGKSTRPTKKAVRTDENQTKLVKRKRPLHSTTRPMPSRQRAHAAERFSSKCLAHPSTRIAPNSTPTFPTTKAAVRSVTRPRRKTTTRRWTSCTPPPRTISNRTRTNASTIDR